MIDIILGIVCFNIILILFKLIGKYNVDNLQAITINYITAGSLSFILIEDFKTVNNIATQPWLIYAMGVGIMFILVFNLLAKSSQIIGVSISTIANKMSLILPVIFAILFFDGESFSWLKMLGIICALVGVYMASTSGKKLNFDKKYLWLIAVIFLGQGLADILFNSAKEWYVDQSLNGIFFIVIFYTAGLVGLVTLTLNIISGKANIKVKNVLWGILLGIPNFLTLWFFFRSLDSGTLEASQINPIYNIGVVVLSSLLGVTIFKEKLSIFNWFGVLFSVFAIISIMLG